MAKQESTAAVTVSTSFNELPVLDDFLLEVRAGIEVGFAERAASSLESSVRGLMQVAVSNNGMDPDSLHLCQFALEAASALRRSVGQEA